MQDFLVDPDWLEQRLDNPGLVIIDCSWYIPEANRSARAEFDDAHIPGAQFFDLEAASDAASPYINMLPSAAHFSTLVGALGIGADTEVVIYDSSYVSARVWWMFRHFGHEKVAILNGGLKRWKAESRPLASGPAAIVDHASFPVKADGTGQVAGWADVLSGLQHHTASVIDARTSERFTGELPSGYPGVAGGHMPGAVNIPWGRLLPQSGDFTFLPPEQARAIFEEAGIDPEKPVIATCGSGITAAILFLQLARMGKTDVTLYDGSWHEWGQRADLPKESLS